MAAVGSTGELKGFISTGVSVLVHVAGSDGGLDVEPDGDGCSDPSRDSGDIGDRGGGILSLSIVTTISSFTITEFGGGMLRSKSSSSSSKSENSSSEPP